ncbi:MAG: hypothetical protein AAF363_10770 [Bacteroidota bacterium]
MKRLNILGLVLALGGLLFVSSCSDDDEGGETAQFDFEGNFAITSATDTNGDDVLPILGQALLADTPCDLNIPNNAALVRLTNGNNALSGTLFNVCAAEPALTEDGGTWSYSVEQRIFTLTLLIDASPVPVPLVQENVSLVPSDGGTVTSISGTVNLASLVAELPTDISLVLTRVQ